MREIDFLPAWYPKVRRKRTMTIVQSWATIGLVAAASLWAFSKHQQVKAAQLQMTELSSAMDHTRSELRKLDKLLALQAQWKQRDQILTKLGLHVESTRLLQKLEEVMPREMAILELELSIDEARPLAGALARVASATVKNIPVDRRMNVRLRGVAPTDVDLAEFLKRLNEVPYFENVAGFNAKDRSESGHMMREYEVTFAINLNAPVEN